MKRKIIIGVIIVTMFVMLAIAPSVHQIAKNDVKSDSTEGRCAGFNYWIKDIFGMKVLKGTFSATWLFSCQNGNFVYGYTPTNTAHAIVTFISSVTVHTSHWTQVAQNHVAYGNIGYHVGIWYFKQTLHYHTTITVKPHSYGVATHSAGSGEYN